MTVSRFARFAFLLLVACLFPTEELAASPGTVPPGACLYALDATASPAFQIAGAQSTYTACGVVVESSASAGFEMEGAGTLYLENHAQVSVVGGADLTGQTELWDTISNKQVQAVQTTNPGDPLASIAPPTTGTIVGNSPTYYDMNSKPANNTISPGVYCGGLEIGNTNGIAFTFSPGVYILAGGGLTLESQADVTGSGVTFYNTSSTGWGCSSSYNYTPVTISGQVTATFSAPTSGSFNGILFFGNRTGCSTKGSCTDQINGGSTAILNGALYFASDEIMITGSNASGYMMLVADKIYINGNSNFGNNGNPFDGITVSVSPTSVSLSASQTQPFTATVTNTANTAVTWSISPSGAGSISTSGLYTAPSSIAAQETVTVKATSQTDTSKVGTATVTLTPPVTKTAPTITFTVANQTYGVAPFTVSATSNSSGAITYSVVSGPATVSGSTVTITGVGSVVLQASQAARGNYTAGTQNATFTVAAEAPTITFTVANHTYGAAPFAVSASSNSSGAFTYSVVSGPATISGSSVTITGVGTVVLKASQAAAGNYTAGTQNATFTVTAEAPTITFTVANQTYGAAPFAVSASSNSSGAFTYSVVSGPATISGSTVTIIGVGTVVLGASQSATTDYSTATASTSFSVSAATPTVTVNPASGTYGTPLTLTATATYLNNGVATATGQTVSYALISGPATVSNGVLTFTGVGSVVVTASVSAAGNFGAATSPQTTITVGQGTPTLSVASSSNPSTYGGSVTFTATISSGPTGTVTFYDSGTSIGTGAISATTATFATNTLAVGAHPITAGWAGNTNYNSVTSSALTQTVNQATQTINFPAISAQTVGTPLTLSATASSGLTVTFTSTTNGVCTVSGTTATFIAGGTCTIDANQAGNSTYTAATMVPQSFQVSQATPTVSAWPTASAITYGQTLASSTLSGGTASVAGTFAWTTPSTAPGAGTPSESVTFTPTASTNYATVAGSVSVKVNQATPTVSAWPTASAITYGQTLASATLSGGTASVAGSFAFTAPTTALGVGIASESVIFTPTDTTDYNTVTGSVSVTVTDALCGSNGFSYERAIVIDHTKVQNTDQANFPILISGTYPFLATVANGGRLQNANGYDVVFTSDSAGQNLLSYEIDGYNGATGAAAYWVQIPSLSHTADTTLYMWYGNPNVSQSQENKPGVWSNGYGAVWHFGTPTTLSTADSTANANNGINHDVLPATGIVGGAGSFNADGHTYFDIPSNASFKPATALTLESWVNMVSPSNYPAILSLDYSGIGNWNSPWIAYSLGFQGGGLQPGFGVTFAGNQAGSDSPNSIAVGQWTQLVGTYDGSNLALYANGVLVSSAPQSGPIDYGASQDLAIGTNSPYDPFESVNGLIDEARISSVARSADWIGTEYNNQSSPSTFYTLYPESAGVVLPSSISMYALQSRQFIAAGTCGSVVDWSISPAGSGAITSNGLYTAPASITTEQTVTVTAASAALPGGLATAIVTLYPPVAVSVTPPTATVYGGQSQPFTATVSNSSNPAVTWAITPSGEGIISPSGVYTAPAVNYQSGGFTAASLALNGNATVLSGGILQLTDGGYDEDSSAWYPAELPIQAFATDFTFQLIIAPTSGADGITFTIQGDGTTALGENGGNLGFAGLPNSVAVKFDTFNNQGEGINSTGLYINGVSPTVPAIDLTPTGINLHSGDVMDAFLLYDGTNLAMKLTDTVTNASATEVFPVNIPGIVGGNVAYVGFTGATGSATSTQDILSWTYMNSTPQSATVTATSVTDPTKSAQAAVTVMPNVTVTATPANVVLYGGQTKQFLANVMNIANTAVNWTIAPATGAGTIGPSGLYTAPGSVTTQQTVTITAASTADPGAFATMTVTLVPQVTLTVTPSGTSLYAGQSQPFTATVTGSANTAVTWAVSIAPSIVVPAGFNLGSISSIGVYTAPPSITQQIPVIVTATSAANTTVFVSTTVTLLPPSSASGTLSIGITAPNSVTLPNTLQLNGTLTDSNPNAVIQGINWSAAGPAGVTFDPQAAVTTATFTQPGNYTLTLSANDGTTSGSVPWPVTVLPAPGTDQGWVASPLYGSTVTGIVPIMLESGISLQSGVLSYYPANNPNNVTVLNSNVTGSGPLQIGTLDTTMLANGSYWIQLQATDTGGNSQYSLVLVTAAGNYKPGRVTATVTDLVVPATGLAINIQRTYDSLNAGTSGDFGYGWNLGINVNLTVDNSGNVTFTLGGQRRTFYLTPQFDGFLPFYDVAFSPEPGFYGTLTDSAPGCADLFDYVVPDGSLWFCVDGAQYNPPGYVYTDPTGTSYTISAAGNLQSIQDRSGNGLTITSTGITSTTGLNVPFVRDSQNRIYEIDDPQGNQYLYGYDNNGNLASVTYPATAQATTCPGASASNTSQYTYYSNPAHFYAGGTDGRCYPLPVSAYYDSTTDGGNSALDGRLLSVTDAFNNTTSYAYTLSTTSIINGVSVPNTGVTTITYPDTGIATMIYDSYGMLLQSTDPLNNTTTNAYDANHDLITVIDPLGNLSTYTYDSNGNKTSSTYPVTPTSSNTTSTTAYNQYSEPTQTTDELGNVRLFNYDANFNPQSVTDSIGTLASFVFNPNQTMQSGAIGFDISVNPAQASNFTYDANGNLASRIDALGRTTSYIYNSLGQKLSMTAPTPGSQVGGSSSTTNYQYDALGDLIQTAAPLSRTTSSTFDANGNKLTDTDARGNTTNYTYDALNRLILTTYPDNTTASKAYDFRNNVVKETDQNNNVTLHSYDLSGRQISVTRGYGTSNASTTTYTYDNDGRKLTETDLATGNTTTYTYDNDGRMTSASGVGGNFTYGYDDAGNRTSVADGKGQTTHFKYDARKRMVETDYPDGTSVKNTYDGPGNLASVTDQAGNVVQYTYDAANQLKSVIQQNAPSPAPNNTNSYGYDYLGNLTGLTDERGDTTQNAYNQLSELTQKTLPVTTLTESRNYDYAGNITSLVHFDGTTTTYTYDALNRLTGRSSNSPHAEPPVSFTYTPTGKYLTSTAQDGTVNYYYDALDRLIKKATPEGTLSYTYYSTGKVATIQSSNANGANVSYTYDGLNRLSTVTDNRLASNNTTTYTYDNASNVATVAYPNGLTSTFAYDELNRLTGLSTPPIANYSYGLGLTGNRTSSTEQSGRTLQWNYNGIYQLTNETITSDPANNGDNNGSASYTLDPVGNRTGANSNFSGFTPVFGSYNPNDQLSNETYDNNGNVIGTANGNSYVYDSENHMIRMSNGSKTVTMMYDAFGNRVSKTVNGVTTQYLVEDDVNPTGYPQVLDELSGTSVARTYTYGLQRISEDQIVNSAWVLSYYQYDGGGSVRQLTNSVGQVTDSYEYDAFGNSFTKQGATPNNYLYRGEQFDSDLGLYYLRARYYNPATGRFLSRDPEDGTARDPASLHKYLYASGDPVNAIDPTGRATALQYAFAINVIAWTDFLVYEYDHALGERLICTEVAILAGIVTKSPWAGGLGGLACAWLFPLPKSPLPSGQ